MSDKPEGWYVPINEMYGWDGEGIKCPSCGSSRLKIYASRPHKNTQRRQRKCIACGHRFYTKEVYSNVNCDTLNTDEGD